MGWTTYHVDGDINRRAEIDRLYSWEDETKRVSVLKSAMVGAVYYAAVELNEKASGEKKVVAVVVLTRVNNRDYWNFAFKCMSEDWGPNEAKCPVGILKLLTPTESNFANDWRKRCVEYHERKGRGNGLHSGKQFLHSADGEVCAVC